MSDKPAERYRRLIAEVQSLSIKYHEQRAASVEASARCRETEEKLRRAFSEISPTRRTPSFEIEDQVTEALDYAKARLFDVEAEQSRREAQG